MTRHPIRALWSSRAVARLVIAAVILGFIPGLLDPFDTPKCFLLIAAGLGLLAMVLVDSMVRGGWRPWADQRLPPVDVAVGLWLAAMGLATLTSIAPRLSVFGEIRQREGLVVWLALAGLYAVARRSHATTAHVRATIDAFLACAGAAALYALAQFYGYDPLAWMRRSTYEAAGMIAVRPPSTLGNPILLGAILVPALAVCAARIASGWRASWRLAPLAAVISAATLTTLSRGAWLAALVAAVFALALAHRSGGRRPLRRTLLIPGITAVAVATWGWLALGAPVLARLAEAGRSGTQSTSGRLEIARSALAMWRDHPWTGTGPNTFGLLFPSYQTAGFWANGWEGVAAHAHSAPLQVLATCGLVAVGAGGIWLVALVITAAFSWRRHVGARAQTTEIVAALGGLAIAGLFNPIGIAGAVMFAVLSALLVAGARAGDPTQSTEHLTAPLARAVGITVAVGACAILAGQLLGLTAASRALSDIYIASMTRTSARTQLLARAAGSIREAVARAPREEELWRLHVDVDLAGARDALARSDTLAAARAASDAVTAARRACQIERRRAANLQRLGNALVMSARCAGDVPRAKEEVEQAHAAFADANRLAPNDALVLVDEFRADLEIGQPERALRTARQIVSLYPSAATGHALEAAADLELGRKGPAAAALRRALAARWDDESEAEHRAAEEMLLRLESAKPSSVRE